MGQHRIALIGLGLIASSMAHALRRVEADIQICGYDRDADVRAAAREIALCDVHDELAMAVENATIIVLAVPVGAMGKVAEQIAPHIQPGAIVTDVGSVKKAVIEEVTPHLPDCVEFVPGHPIAGTEYSGPRSGFATLFDNRYAVLCPTSSASQASLVTIRELWQSLGATVEVMEADHHDLVFAVTSHVPHLIAYTMVGVADDLKRVTDTEVMQFSASGFRDFTRIAASDPVMWRDVFLNNKEASLEILGRFTEELFALQRAIRTGQGDVLETYFAHTRAIRRGILELGQDVSAPDFGRIAALDDKTETVS